jgi:UrcA family protein
MITHSQAVLGVAFALVISHGAIGHPLEPTDAPMQMSVRVADLRLETDAGRRIARARLELAAEEVCGPEPSSIRNLVSQMRFDDCVRHAMQDANRRLAEMTATSRQASR